MNGKGRIMARLCKHGAELARITGLTWAKTYHADGTNLKDHGFGWKVHGHVKAGKDPAERAREAMANHAAALGRFPALAEYRRLLHDAGGLSVRWKIHAAVCLLPGDPDGVWSELTDHDFSAHKPSVSIEECVELCAAYRLALTECDGAGCRVG